MEKIKSNRYMIVYSTNNSNKRYLVNRYAELNPGDKVAVQHGNIADIETLSTQNKHNLILGKVTSIITALP